MKCHIFKVYDYKGGELGLNLNLSEIDMIGELFGEFEEDLTFEELLQEVFQGNIYAGDSCTDPEVYYTDEDGNLIPYEFDEERIMSLLKEKRYEWSNCR